MPIAYQIDHTQRLVDARAHGLLTDEDVFHYQREVWGRPVGLLLLPDGSLLVTDDGANKIWRISYQAPQSARNP